MPSHDMVEILLQNDLCIYVIRLKIIVCNSDDALVC